MNNRRLMRAAVLVGALVLVLAPASAPASQEMDHAHALVMLPGSHSLFLGTHNGLVQSKDEGRTWVPVPLPEALKGVDVMTLVADPSNRRLFLPGPTSAASSGAAMEGRLGRR